MRSAASLLALAGVAAAADLPSIVAKVRQRPVDFNYKLDAKCVILLSPLLGLQILLSQWHPVFHEGHRLPARSGRCRRQV